MVATAESVAAADRARLAAQIDGRMTGRGDLVTVNTCHRLELYGLGVPPDLGANLRILKNVEAVRHLMRLATGLESAIVGEDEILHQVRDALVGARSRGALDTRLDRLFDTAIAAGRRARSGRAVAGMGLAGAAIEWLGGRAALAAGQVVVVAGAGRMGSALARSARAAGAAVVIASRSPDRAVRLAQVYGGRGVGLAEGAELVPACAGVAVALAGVWDDLLAAAVPLPPIVDISAPQAVPASVRNRLGSSYLGIDALFVNDRPPPCGYVKHAEQVVETKTAEYTAWLEARSPMSHRLIRAERPLGAA